jgi:hypothetical protein
MADRRVGLRNVSDYPGRAAVLGSAPIDIL